LKSLLRKAAARTRETLDNAIADSLTRFSPNRMREFSRKFRISSLTMKML
jgi:hypothetical protein